MATIVARLSVFRSLSHCRSVVDFGFAFVIVLSLLVLAFTDPVPPAYHGSTFIAWMISLYSGFIRDGRSPHP